MNISWVDVWNFLNQNFISSIVTAILFSVFLSSFIKSKNRMKRLDNLFEKLSSQLFYELNSISDYLEKIVNYHDINKILKELEIIPSYMLRTVLSREYIEYVDLESARFLLVSIQNIEKLNELYYKIDKNKNNGPLIMDYSISAGYFLNNLGLKDFVKSPYSIFDVLTSNKEKIKTIWSRISNIFHPKG